MVGILVAGGAAMILALIGTPFAIRLLQSRGFGQPIQVDLPDSHQVKRGTPTMGGAVIILAAVAGYFAVHLIDDTSPMTSRALLVIAAMAALGLVGFADDYRKVRHRRSVGLSKSAKLTGQIACGVLLALGAWYWVHAYHGLSFVRPLPGTGLVLGLYVLWVVFIIAAAANGVNLTDGMDGLAPGSAVLVMSAFVVVSFWQGRHSCFSPGALRGCYVLPAASSLDVAVLAAAVMGATAGFLWWNAPPARIIMGDTGSLALGGAFAALALVTETQLLLAVIGGLFVVETLSVIAQVASFRLLGRRVFKMAPIHLHFELSGWPEFTVIVRFWLLSGLAVAFGLALFYADFLARGGGGGG